VILRKSASFCCFFSPSKGLVLQNVWAQERTVLEYSGSLQNIGAAGLSLCFGYLELRETKNSKKTCTNALSIRGISLFLFIYLFILFFFFRVVLEFLHCCLYPSSHPSIRYQNVFYLCGGKKSVTSFQRHPIQ
jgi:hypothetical protein